MIKNKDIPILQRVICVMQEIRALEARRLWQKDRMSNISQHLSGMPRGGGGPTGLDAAFAALDELEEEHKERVKEYARELKAAERIINCIPSHTMRVFAVMMYVENIPASKVRGELNMTERGFRSARYAVEQAEDMASVKWRERYVITREEN
ncbi:hypothetical protein EOM89_08275 [Candidatus Falkowbacteria bacterium]|nr:hypothetical protein [Candidatus Falkowbacteria bacterium]